MTTPQNKKESLEERFMVEYIQNSPTWLGGEGVIWLKTALTTYKNALVGEIKGKLPKEMQNTQDESDNDWFYGFGFNSSLIIIRQILSDL